MDAGKLFNILDSVESTNNYAMAQVHAGLAKPGMAWLAIDQWGGKGQRGKQWLAYPGENIILTMAWQPDGACITHPFLFSMRVALIARAFTARYLGKGISLKWPNDIYRGDRKAGGILIENTFNGQDWTWALTGIGININQESFPSGLTNPVSFRQVTGKTYDVLLLARELHEELIKELSQPMENPDLIMEKYNQQLYSRGKMVRLKKGSQVFETTITGVNLQGKLLTRDVIDREFDVGEVEFVIR